ncbi:MAG: pore-forming ESAT-6 family protein [Anaerorhabdus sp.]|uniref:pore-forming ESAT-6 family protein n=1 Tax=Anaerorhabdus sp. TaxID=1872524 RepID=UPI002B204739|nr:pore-forming ESAT-6 family protein [Anaerorhabdus sp.]MEA4875069.1 pore-forming ESAT-6 family protein [Anaerorhabdus sp.]
MDDIKISLNEVSECVGQLRNLGNQIYDHLQLIKKEMDSLNGSWISESGETIRGKFTIFSNRFDQQREVIQSYATFLDLTVSSYDSLENTINANASNF